MRTDEELFEAWRCGDRTAGNVLCRRHFWAIRRFFQNKVDREVEELVQQTFARCVEGRARYAGRSSFRIFLFGVARNVLREFYRGGRHCQPAIFSEQSVRDMGAGPSTALAKRQEQRLLLEALRRIPMELQVVLELYYWEELTGVELGEILDVPERTARSRVRRAKQLLEKALTRIKASPEALQSTMSNLDGWAAKVRASFEPNE